MCFQNITAAFSRAYKEKVVFSEGVPTFSCGVKSVQSPFSEATLMEQCSTTIWPIFFHDCALNKGIQPIQGPHNKKSSSLNVTLQCSANSGINLNDQHSEHYTTIARLIVFLNVTFERDMSHLQGSVDCKFSSQNTFSKQHTSTSSSQKVLTHF